MVEWCGSFGEIMSLHMFSRMSIAVWESLFRSWRSECQFKEDDGLTRENCIDPAKSEISSLTSCIPLKSMSQANKSLAMSILSMIFHDKSQKSRKIPSKRPLDQKFSDVHQTSWNPIPIHTRNSPKIRCSSLKSHGSHAENSGWIFRWTTSEVICTTGAVGRGHQHHGWKKERWTSSEN